MNQLEGVSSADQTKALSLSTAAFAVCFAVWTIFSIIGVKIKQDLGLNDTQFGLLVGTPILTGSLSRIFLGIWADQYGGRIVYTAVMVFAAIATLLLSYADTYPMMLLAALGVGLAGGSFAVGVTYVSRWYQSERQGTALGIFGVGNIGAAVTAFGAPFVLVAYGWQAVAQAWAAALIVPAIFFLFFFVLVAYGWPAVAPPCPAALIVTAILFWLLSSDDPEHRERRVEGRPRRSIAFELQPLQKLQVWRFSLYYFFVFGAFVGLALWLPRYLVGVYGLDIKTAGILAACYSVPASLFRAYGGHLSDRYGARKVMYWTFFISVLCTFLLSYPLTDYVVHGIKGPIAFSFGIGLIPFVLITFVLGFFMSLGKAAVYKHIPVYYPHHVGSVGGTVGMIGGLGGFFLPLAFGVMNDMTGVWTSCFMLLFALVAVALIWMHVSILRMERSALQEGMRELPQLPEMEEIHTPKHAEAMGPVVRDWRPEDEEFWRSVGRRIAQRNLWISIPCLLLAFSVWLVWSVVVAKLPTIGFNYTTDQLFWLAALPGLSGATLRIFYTFMVPIFGGRLWTTLSTASLLIPAVGIGYAVQDPDTPYSMFLLLALLCGFGGGNFASSMANIAYFFPRAQKGNALALNAGLGNAGVSVMQFVVPLVITAGVFGALGGEPQTTTAGGKIWLQNAGYVWVPFLLISTVAAWMGLNDIAAAKSSFREQSVIFERKHNWVMCWLYTGTFGSFIGYSAGFPLLAKTQFPGVDSLQYVFLGPLIGALSRAATGWISDKYGGGRVTFWTFLLMIFAVLGVLYFLDIKDQPGAFWGFFAMFMLLFLATGIGNASTFQMIPVIMREEITRLMPGETPAKRQSQSEMESAAIIGFTSAIAAYGAFFIPKSYGTSISLTGGPEAALWGFVVFYASCLFITWLYYTRKRGMLHDVERGLKRPEPAATAAGAE